MKKLILILNILLINYSASAQYLDKDFNDLSLSSGGWTTQIIIDTTNWFVSSFSGDDFVKASNYSNSQNIPSNMWLISPGIDLSSASQPMLNFETIMKFQGSALILHVSTDYDGTSNPTQQGTWTDITSLATWDIDNTSWGNWTPSGDIDLSNYTSSSTYIAYEYSGSANSGSTWEIDNIIITEGSAPPPPPPGIDSVSIYDIQFNINSNGASNYEGSQVYTGGIVYAIRNDSSFYITSGSGAWSGVYVYSNDYLLSVGDSVTFNAEVVEFYDLTELKTLNNLTIVNSGNTPITNNCTTGSATSEEFEGCLIQVSNANCNNADAGFGEWIVNDGTGDLAVDDLFYDAIGAIPSVVSLNNNYNIKGAVTYSFEVFKLLPRNSGDVSEFVSISEFYNKNFKFYPNPLNNNLLNIFVTEPVTITIYDYLGKVVNTESLNKGLNTVQFSNLSVGLYFIKCNSEIYRLSKI